MIIKKATKQDLPAIEFLMQQYGKMSVDESLFNHRDIALQARDESGELAGFIWCGLMAKGKVGYIDKFCVDPSYSRQHVGNMLLVHLVKELNKRKVKDAFGIIAQDVYHDKSAINALKVAMGSIPVSYTRVYMDVKNSINELSSLGAI